MTATEVTWLIAEHRAMLKQAVDNGQVRVAVPVAIYDALLKQIDALIRDLEKEK